MFNKKFLCKMIAVGVLMGATEFVPNIVDLPIVYAQDSVFQVSKEVIKFMSLGNYKKAIEICTEGLQNYPDSDLLYSHRSTCYSRLKEYDKAIELDSYNLRHYESKASIYRDMNKYDKVVEI